MSVGRWMEKVYTSKKYTSVRGGKWEKEGEIYVIHKHERRKIGRKFCETCFYIFPGPHR